MQKDFGTADRQYQLYNSTATGGTAEPGTFGKAAGLGDIELLCSPAPIEIGNRVWTDTDNDGIQDPNEAGIDGVTVKLYKGGTLIGTATTAGGGRYGFSSASAGTATGFVYAITQLQPDMNYEIRIEGFAAQTPLSNLSPTTADNGGSDINTDIRDSDGTLSGANVVKTFSTAGAGDNNHNYDFGFKALPLCTAPTITNVSTNTATCTNGVANSDAEVHVTGIGNMAKYAYRTNATDSLWSNTATASTATSIDLTGLLNPSVATTYTFRIWGIDTTCFNDTTVVLNPAVCLTCSITATFTQGSCNNNGTTAIATDDYFTVLVSAVSATNGGTSGKYEVVLNGTVLNTGGTAYGTSVTVGTTTTFKSDGSTTYNLTVRDLDQPTCMTTIFTTAASAACSIPNCKPMICIPVTVTRAN